MNKIIDKVVKVEEVTKFVAIDGTVFTCEESCRKYEKSLECTICAAWNKIPKGTVDFDMLFLGGCSDDGYIVIKPRNLDDVKIINMYCRFNEKEALTQDDIGKEICIEDCCGEYYKLSSSDIFQTVINDINKCKAKVFTDLNNYGYYELVAQLGEHSFAHSDYSYNECLNRIKYKIKGYLSNFDGIQSHTVKITAKKDGEHYDTSDYNVQYNKETYEFKFVKAN